MHNDLIFCFLYYEKGAFCCLKHKQEKKLEEEEEDEKTPLPGTKIGCPS